VTTMDEARSAFVDAANALTRRRRNATSPQEKEAIDGAIEDINAKIDFLNQAGLLQAAVAVSEAANALQAIVASARLDPLASSVSELEIAVQELTDVQGRIHATEALPKAEPPSNPPPAAPASTAAPPPPALSKPIDSTDFGQLRQEYQAFYDASTVRPAFKGDAAFYVSRLMKFRSRYEAVGQGFRIPWQFIGIIHALESSFNFGTHLHNGDPLTARTVHVPAGRPANGNPPFTWEDSARDALQFEGFDKEPDWSVPHMLFLWEKYNGMGYRPFGVPSPYLWSFSHIYTTGKFVADGRFDPTVVSKQCGAAVMLKALEK
jgi:lysozyme family protein